jgi:hypothetical protein
LIDKQTVRWGDGQLMGSSNRRHAGCVVATAEAKRIRLQDL